MYIKKNRSMKAQSTIEYIAVILVVILVLIVAGQYYRRSLQAKYREIGDGLGAGEQYSR